MKLGLGGRGAHRCDKLFFESQLTSSQRKKKPIIKRVSCFFPSRSPLILQWTACDRGLKTKPPGPPAVSLLPPLPRLLRCRLMSRHSRSGGEPAPGYFVPIANFRRVCMFWPLWTFMILSKRKVISPWKHFWGSCWRIVDVYILVIVARLLSGNRTSVLF